MCEALIYREHHRAVKPEPSVRACQLNLGAQIVCFVIPEVSLVDLQLEYNVGPKPTRTAHCLQASTPSNRHNSKTQPLRNLAGHLSRGPGLDPIWL